MDRILSTDQNILIYLLLFLDDRSLCRLSQSCKFIYSSEKLYADIIWKKLCEKRWLNFRNILRIIGTTSYKDAFHIMNVRKLFPRGKYTEKRHQVFGFGRKNRISAWIFIDHSIDCKPRAISINRTLERVITLKICLQNIGHDQVTLENAIYVEDLINHEHSKSYDAIEVIMKGYGSKDGSNHFCASLSNIALKAINGDFRTQYQAVHRNYGKFKYIDINLPSLGYLDSMVFSLDVQCSEDVVNEVDFLCSIQEINLYCKCVQHKPHYLERRVRIDCKILDEDDIWKHYIPLPRGLVYLREDAKA